MEIAIIGGGITGLTTALSLKKVGLNCTVYEKATELNEIGAGIWLQPNAMQILKWLGLEKEIQGNGCMLNKMEITNSALSPFKKIDATAVSDNQGNQTIAIHRGKLQQILYQAYNKVGKVELGSDYSSHTTVEDKVHIEFENKTAQADLLLGADGIHSKVRHVMALPSIYRSTNQICCRGIAQYQLPEYLINEGKEMWGKKMRFGFSQIAEKSVYFFAVLNKEICPLEMNIETLAASFRDFNPIVTELIKATSHLHTTELVDLKRLNTWHTNLTCLIGDAAHATTPNMGQGACQGIEDAYYISHILKNQTSSIEEAFRHFENIRRKKVDYVVNNSWMFGKMAHQKTGQFLLRSIMKLTPEKIISEQMNKLYNVEKF